MMNIKRTVTLNRSIFISPLVLFIGTWVVTTFLYGLQLSNLLSYEPDDYYLIISYITIPFLLGWLVVQIVFSGVQRKIEFEEANVLLIRLNNRVLYFFNIWIAITIVEIIVSGGLPLLWLVTGSSKTYFDYGIPSLHGFMNALILSISLISFYLYKSDKKFKKNIYIVIFSLLWGIVTVSRNLIIVNILQILILYLSLSKIKIKSVILITLLGLFLIIGFGVMGDSRSGADNFVSVAQPSSNYPQGLPSGFLWVYMYIATPLNNLIYVVKSFPPDWNYNLKHATTSLFPTVIRALIYPNDSSESIDYLVTQAFNVSTAFTDFYRDVGLVGISIVTFILGMISEKFWRTTNRTSLMYYAIISQSNILSIFYNHYFYLPILAQYFIVKRIARP